MTRPARQGRRTRRVAVARRAPGEPELAVAVRPGPPGWHVECAAISLSRIGSRRPGRRQRPDLPAPRFSAAHAESVTGERVRAPLRARRHDRLGRHKMSRAGATWCWSRGCGRGVDPAAIRLGLLAGHFTAATGSGATRCWPMPRPGCTAGAPARRCPPARTPPTRHPGPPLPGRRPGHPESARRRRRLDHRRPGVRRARRERTRSGGRGGRRCSAFRGADPSARRPVRLFRRHEFRERQGRLHHRWRQRCRGRGPPPRTTRAPTSCWRTWTSFERLTVRGDIVRATPGGVCTRRRARPSSLQRLADQAVEQFGGIDIVIANAGSASGGSVLNVDPAAFKTGIDVNVMGSIQHRAAALPSVIDRRGYVLVVSSLAPYAPIAGSACPAWPRPGSSTSPTRCAWRWPTTGRRRYRPHVVDRHPLVRDGTAEFSSMRAAIEEMPGPLSKITWYSRRPSSREHRAAPTATSTARVGWACSAGSPIPSTGAGCCCCSGC